MIPVEKIPVSTIWRKPRASGDDPTTEITVQLDVWVNPARAGMIRIRSPLLSAACCKPRASGDDPATEGVGYTDPQ